MKKWQKEIYKDTDIVGKITLDALDLAKSHTRWKTNKGSIKSFSRATGKFIEAVQDNLNLKEED